ncbi:hypothetical protein V492_03562 [Pseudogymnoascus sp. VKM F-4246]|nr:hypothetical protein V492_03562 [Pseudogymnoascus sp. VKM F-4246]
MPTMIYVGGNWLQPGEEIRPTDIPASAFESMATYVNAPPYQSMKIHIDANETPVLLHRGTCGEKIQPRSEATFTTTLPPASLKLAKAGER